MTDFYAKRIYLDGREFWKVFEVGSNQVLAVGDTITQAVNNYFIYETNKEAKRKLGIETDDLSF